MGLRLRLRSLIFPCILTAALALAAITLIFFLRGGEVPPALVNSRVLGRIAARYGVQYSVRSLRIGSFLGDCRSPVDAGGVRFSFRDLGPADLEIDSLHWCSTEPAAIHGLMLGVPSQPGLVGIEDVEGQLNAGTASIRNLSLNVNNGSPTPQMAIGGIELSRITGNAVASDIRISTGLASSANIQRVSMSALVFSRQTGVAKLDSIDAAGVDVRLQNVSPASSQAPSICERTRSVLSASADMAASAEHSIDALNQTLVLFRGDLFYLSLIVPSILFLLKVWTLAWTRRWGLRVLLGALPAAAPALLYSIGGRGRPLLQLVALSFAISFVLALILRFRFYRHASQWYQRWEPFTVDLACFAIVLPLAASGFDFGGPLRLPTAFEIGRVNAADISLSGAQSQCGARQVVAVTAKGAAIEQVRLDNSGVQIARVDLPGISAGVHDERTPDRDIVTVSGVSAAADEVGVRIDWNARQIRDLDAHFRMRGMVKGLTGPFGPASGGGPGIDFDVDLKATGAQNEPAITEDLRKFGDTGTTVAFRGAIALDPDHCDLKYAWAARMLTAPVRLVSTGLGDTSTIDIRSIRTLLGSAFQIADGAGRISLAKDIQASLRLMGLRGPAGGSEVQIDSTDFSGTVAPPCSQIHQTLSAGINGTRIEGPGGLNARIERTEVEFNRAAASRTNPVSLVATVRDTRFTAPQISGNLPLLTLSIEGSTTPESIPRRFEGGVALSLSTATDVLFRNNTPLKILADLREGAVTVPDQQQVVYQSIISQLPGNVPLSISLNNWPQGGGVATRIRFPGLFMDLGALRTEIRDLQIDADTSTSTFAYESGWNRVSLPALPSVFCLEDISQFDLSTEGSITRLLLPAKLTPEFPNPLGRCVEAPSLPTESSFKLQGVWPSIRLEGMSGFGVQIRDLSSNQLQAADLRDGRLRSLELESTLSGIQTLGAAGELALKTHLKFSGGAGAVQTSLLGANDAPLVDMALDGLPARPEIDIVPQAGTQEVVTALKPFFSSAGIGLGGITPLARIDRLHAGLQFEGAALASLNAQLDLRPGPLASMDYSADTAAPRTLDLSIIEDPANPSGNNLRFNWIKGAVEVHADLAQLSMRAADPRGAEIQATAALHTTVHGTLSERRPPPDPILAKVSGTVGDLRRHFEKAVEVFGNPAASVSPPVDFNWKLRIHNSPASESLLQLAPEAVGVRLAGNVENFAWRTGQSDLSRVAGEGEFSADLTIHDGQLVLDAYTPARFEASLGTNPARKVELDLPVLAVFSDALENAPDPSVELWNSEYYTRFWNTYRVTQANRGADAIVDTTRFVAGPMSLRQVVFPSEPLRIAVGHAERFELHVPFSGRILFGAAGGLFQTALTWRGDQASVEGRFNLALRNIQAGAVGIDSEYGHTPFVEDELDGDLIARTDDWRLDRNAVDNMLGAQSPGGLGAFGLRLKLRKSERSQSIPGMLQLSTDTEVNTLNIILNKILRDLRLANPPQKMSYRNLEVDFRMDKGKVATDVPWLKIDGLRLFSSTDLALDGNIRLHGTRDGETLELRNLLDAFIPR